MSKKAFTLIETLVAIGIITVGVIALLGALSGMIRHFALLQRQTVALMFAREGLELAKSIVEVNSVDNSTTGIPLYPREYYYIKSSTGGDLTNDSSGCIGISCKIGPNSVNTPFIIKAERCSWADSTQCRIQRYSFTAKPAAQPPGTKNFIYAQDISGAGLTLDASTDPYVSNIMRRKIYIELFVSTIKPTSGVWVGIPRSSTGVVNQMFTAPGVFDTIRIHSQVEWKYRGKTYTTPDLTTTFYRPFN